MAVNKEHREFYELDMDNGWETPKGYPPGIKQKILSGHLDHVPHGPFRTETGCLLLEQYYYDPQ